MLAPPRNELHRSRHRAASIRARFGRCRGLIILLLQILAVSLVLQISDLAHVAADVLGHLDATADCGHERSGDSGDRECPPGCPTCHSCAHAQAPYVPRTAHVGTAPITIAPAPDEEDGPPTQNERSSIFRPPRALRFAA
jgi:hypothetical protein